VARRARQAVQQDLFASLDLPVQERPAGPSDAGAPAAAGPPDRAEEPAATVPARPGRRRKAKDDAAAAEPAAGPVPRATGKGGRKGRKSASPPEPPAPAAATPPDPAAVPQAPAQHAEAQRTDPGRTDPGRTDPDRAAPDPTEAQTVDVASLTHPELAHVVRALADDQLAFVLTEAARELRRRLTPIDSDSDPEGADAGEPGAGVPGAEPSPVLVRAAGRTVATLAEDGPD
jgi:hypothetical protein